MILGYAYEETQIHDTLTSLVLRAQMNLFDIRHFEGPG